MKKSAEIITLYGSQNYGAFLQSYAMQTVLQKMGYEVSFIKLDRSDVREFIYIVKTKNIKLAIFRVRQYMQYLKSSNLLKINKKAYRGEPLDAVIIGSDTLWDVQNPTIAADEFFLGKGLNADHIVAYAVSGNNTTADDFRKVYREDGAFDSFTEISVRDSNTGQLVKDIANQTVPIVLDPTLLLDCTDYPVEEPEINQRIVLVYGYSFSEKEQKIIRAEADKRGARIISIGLLNTWADKNVVATVPEFLGYLKRAEIVFTGTFHGTIFSVILKKKFVTFARNNFKVLYLLEQVGLTERNGSSNLENCSEIIEKEIDYKAVYDRLGMLRKQSISFLKDALN